MRHDARCLRCSEADHESDKDWQELVVKMRGIVTSSENTFEEEPGIEPGQFHRINKGLATWRNHKYYNPPLVLVMEDIGKRRNEVVVAQTFHDITLAGPGDLILSREESSLGELFIECWNRTRLPCEALGPKAARIPPMFLDMAQRLAADPGEYPSGAIHPRPITANDPRISFRELESEVAWIFASRARNLYPSAAGLSRLFVLHPHPDEVMRSLSEKMPGVSWKTRPQSPEEALIFAAPPPDRLALAADDSGRGLVPVNLIITHNGRILEFSPLEAEILSELGAESRMSVSGRILNAPEGIKGSVLLSHLMLADQSVIPPENVDWDEERGSFAADFGTACLQGYTLALALVFDVDAQTEETDP